MAHFFKKKIEKLNGAKTCRNMDNNGHIVNLANRNKDNRERERKTMTKSWPVGMVQLADRFLCIAKILQSRSNLWDIFIGTIVDCYQYR